MVDELKKRLLAKIDKDLSYNPVKGALSAARDAAAVVRDVVDGAIQPGAGLPTIAAPLVAAGLQGQSPAPVPSMGAPAPAVPVGLPTQLVASHEPAVKILPPGIVAPAPGTIQTAPAIRVAAPGTPLGSAPPAASPAAPGTPAPTPALQVGPRLTPGEQLSNIINSGGLNAALPIGGTPVPDWRAVTNEAFRKAPDQTKVQQLLSMNKEFVAGYKPPPGTPMNFGETPGLRDVSKTSVALGNLGVPVEKNIQFESGKDLQRFEGVPGVSPEGDTGRWSPEYMAIIKKADPDGKYGLQFQENPFQFLAPNGTLSDKGIATLQKENDAAELKENRKKAALELNRDIAGFKGGPKTRQDAANERQAQFDKTWNPTAEGTAERESKMALQESDQVWKDASREDIQAHEVETAKTLDMYNRIIEDEKSTHAERLEATKQRGELKKQRLMDQAAWKRLGLTTQNALAVTGKEVAGRAADTATRAAGDLAVAKEKATASGLISREDAFKIVMADGKESGVRGDGSYGPVTKIPGATLEEKIAYVQQSGVGAVPVGGAKVGGTFRGKVVKEIRVDSKTGRRALKFTDDSIAWE